jgi:hypothetical protein
MLRVIEHQMSLHLLRFDNGQILYDGLKDIVSTWMTINREVLISFFQGQSKLSLVLGYV